MPLSFTKAAPAVGVSDLFIPVQFYDPTYTPSDELNFSSGWCAVQCPDNTEVEFGSIIRVPDNINNVDDLAMWWFVTDSTNDFDGTFQIVGDDADGGDPSGAASKSEAPIFSFADTPDDELQITKIDADLGADNIKNVQAGDYLSITVHRDAGSGSDVVYFIGFILYLS